MIETDIVIIGAGIIGLSLAREINNRHPDLRIIIVEKEDGLGYHASGRNSGVLHAGFYYTPESLKARFTAEGNRQITEYCLSRGISINQCGKIVVAKNADEIKWLYELEQRGKKNGVELQLIDEKELQELEPNTRTFQKALYSPATSVVNPKEVLNHIANTFWGKVSLLFNERFVKRNGDNSINTNRNTIYYKHLINSAGLYADKIAHQYGIGLSYTLIPFKGLYLQYNDDSLIKKHIYPVPDLRNPFLGVHFTKTVDGKVKIGPTAIPAFWRENYKGVSRFNFSECIEVLFYESKLLLLNSFNFRGLLLEETRKYSRKHFINQASHLVKKIDVRNFGQYLTPGIRAQLLNTKKMKLEMDFVIKQGENSTHILNAVSPAFTSAFSFSKYVADLVMQTLEG